MSGEDQGDERKRTIDEVSKQEMTSKRAASRTPGLVQGKPVYCLSGVRHKDGVTLIQALVWNVGTFAPRGCKRDRGRPSEIGMQVQISNHLKLLWSKAMVVSVGEKAHEMRQV